MVAVVVMFLNVDPAGQEHGLSMLLHGGRGRGREGEAEASKGIANATAVRIWNILDQRRELGRGVDGQISQIYRKYY